MSKLPQFVTEELDLAVLLLCKNIGKIIAATHPDTEPEEVEVELLFSEVGGRDEKLAFEILERRNVFKRGDEVHKYLNELVRNAMPRHFPVPPDGYQILVNVRRLSSECAKYEHLQSSINDRLQFDQEAMRIKFRGRTKPVKSGSPLEALVSALFALPGKNLREDDINEHVVKHMKGKPFPAKAMINAYNSLRRTLRVAAGDRFPIVRHDNGLKLEQK